VTLPVHCLKQSRSGWDKPLTAGLELRADPDTGLRVTDEIQKVGRTVWNLTAGPVELGSIIDRGVVHMFVVMNRISVNSDYTEQFEERFRNRAGEVDKMKGFVRNQVLRPGNPDDPYIVMTYWDNKADFEAWVNSEAFQKGHAKSGTLPPEAFRERAKLENFDVILDTDER
jgi:heme-degrading monooxygenase HmoA